MNTINIGAEGRVVARRLDKHSNEIQRLAFSNAFLDAGMDFLIEQYCTTINMTTMVNNLNVLFLGTGTTEPTAADAGLESRSVTLAGKDLVSSNPFAYPVTVGADTQNHVYWTEANFVFKYGEGEAEGVWTELGLANDTNYTQPMTRALFRDETGAATSLTILSDEYLEVTYTVRFYSGNGAPAPGSFMLGGDTINYTVYPVVGNEYTGWTANGRLSQYGDSLVDSGIWAYYFPFARLTMVTGIEGYPWTYIYNTACWSGPEQQDTYSITYDALTRTVTHTMTVDPTPGDVSIAGLGSHSANAANSSVYWEQGLMAIKFDTPLVKKADYRVTLTVDITYNIQLAPVSNIALDAAAATTLDFSWDAYPDASEYEVVLRQAGTVIDTQTITAPTATASFTGLTASTEYHVDVAATTTAGRESVNAILAGSTTA